MSEEQKPTSATASSKENTDIDLDALLWTPGSENVEVVKKEDIANIEFSKDKKKQTIAAAEQLNAITKSLQELNNIPKDVANILSLTKDDEVITACSFAEQRGFSSFVTLGRMVLEVEGLEKAELADPMLNPMTVEMGTLWDRTDYTYLEKSDLQTLQQNLSDSLKRAYDSLEALEDKWIDKKSDETNAKNQENVNEWVRNHVLDLTRANRELVELIRKHRISKEDKIERPKYDSLGAALKAKDVEEFTRMLTKAAYDKKDKGDLEVMNKLVSYAIKNGIAGVIEPLVKHGADIKQLDNEGRTFFMLALENNNLELAKALKDNGVLTEQKDLNGVTELILAIKSGNIDALKYLVDDLKQDSDNELYGLNSACWKGYTALVYAASEENLEMVSYLLEKGADPTHTVWYEGEASMEDYTETPEIEELILEAKAKRLGESKSSAFKP